MIDEGDRHNVYHHNVHFDTGAASVARAWSGYVDSLLGGAVSNITISLVGEMHEELFGKYPDFLAFAVCISYACVLGVFISNSLTTPFQDQCWLFEFSIL